MSLCVSLSVTLSHTEGLRAHAESESTQRARETDGAPENDSEIDDEPMRIVESEVEQIALSLWLHRVMK